MRSRSEETVFGIETISDYLEFVNLAVKELSADEANVLRGFSAIIALNHIPDWLQYKLTQSERAALGLSDTSVGTCVKKHFEKLYPKLITIREIANGFKHLRPVHSTMRIEGFGKGPFGIGPFNAAYLLIDVSADMTSKDR
jgi:hypothetical protein